jgi:hypothetical protein
MPRGCLSWDVLCGLGHRRFSRPWSVPQLRLELKDTDQIRWSGAAIEPDIGQYPTVLAARQQDPAQLAEAYRDIESLVLTIDGLPPEKGHETLDGVRELRRKRGWCAAPLWSRAPQEGRRLIVVARQWAERLAKPVRGWMSDKQEAFVTAIADEFVGPPHRSCHNHCLRDVAQPVRDMESRAQGKMRRQGRGVRAIERRVVAARRQAAAPEPLPPDEGPKPDGAPRVDPSKAAAALCASSDPSLVPRERAMEATGLAPTGEAPGADEVGEVVLGYGAAVRGMLNDSQGGPLHPPG